MKTRSFVHSSCKDSLIDLFSKRAVCTVIEWYAKKSIEEIMEIKKSRVAALLTIRAHGFR